MSLFEKATRQKLRFPTTAGLATVEDLWDLPLQSTRGASLDSTAIALNKSIKALGEESFVSTKPVGNDELTLKFDIVKHIIEIKKTEAAARAKIAETKAAKEKLLGLIAQKQDENLAAKSVEELQALVNQLGE